MLAELPQIWAKLAGYPSLAVRSRPPSAGMLRRRVAVAAIGPMPEPPLKEASVSEVTTIGLDIAKGSSKNKRIW